MGAFDAQFSEYHHLIDEVWASPALVEFGGRVQFKVDDGRRDAFLQQVLHRQFEWTTQDR